MAEIGQACADTSQGHCRQCGTCRIGGEGTAWCSAGVTQPCLGMWAVLQPQDLVEDEALFTIQPMFIEYLPHGRESSRNCGGDTGQVRQGSCPPGDDVLADEANGDPVTEPRTR